MKGLSGDSESTHGVLEASGGEESRACPACGARARRAGARFCATCGRALGGGYFPADSVRASYRFERAPAPEKRQHGPVAPARSPRRAAGRRAAARGGVEFMPRARESGAAATAFAFVTYALVPYLGILFCPGAVLFGGWGLVRAWRAPHASAGAARASALGIALGLLVLCVQLVLWWILYKVPEWSRAAPF
ncbi:MAG: hypothetical protein LC795_11195 [Acidobacteria bacterium]|nr:hypothetical protein [Acidobacteriota bacterium]MCA1619856.1 hypothetical protein [Acidobacteriota bacterium]